MSVQNITLIYIVRWNTSTNIHTLTHPCIWLVTFGWRKLRNVLATKDLWKLYNMDQSSSTMPDTACRDYYLYTKLQGDLAAATGSTLWCVQINFGVYSVMLIHIANDWLWSFLFHFIYLYIDMMIWDYALEESGQSMKLTAHLCLLLRLRMSGGISPLSQHLHGIQRYTFTFHSDIKTSVTHK